MMRVASEMLDQASRYRCGAVRSQRCGHIANIARCAARQQSGFGCEDPQHSYGKTIVAEKAPHIKMKPNQRMDMDVKCIQQSVSVRGHVVATSLLQRLKIYSVLRCYRMQIPMTNLVRL